MIEETVKNGSWLCSPDNEIGESGNQTTRTQMLKNSSIRSGAGS
ncbi:MAG: hypothetical protein R3B93_10715 [Bacteroidia bacterium]